VTDKQVLSQTEEPTLETLGRRLKEEREKIGLTRSDIASRTKITIDQINNIEDGRISNMPTVYARGFLRSYCELLNLNTEEILVTYRKLTSKQESDSSRPLTSKYVNNDFPNESRSHLWPIFGTLILLICLFLAALYLSPSFKELVVNYLPESIQEKLVNIENPSTAEASPVEQVAEPEPETFSGRLTLRAERTTWAQVTVDDRPIEHIFFEPGQSRSFDGQRNIAIVAGDGQALMTEWSGQERGPLGREGPVEVFYSLTAEAPL
jgi:cytoskeleton protein RodZ